jgi:hypothetical protein
MLSSVPMMGIGPIAALWLSAGCLLNAAPPFDKAIVDGHRQVYASSIASSVEMVLKLTGHVGPEFFGVQEAWRDKTEGSFADFDKVTISGLTFRRQYALPRNRQFPLAALFAAIDSELDAGRYVIVGLTNGAWGLHNWVIIGRTPKHEYRAVSKSGTETIEITNARAVIRRMNGTDIGTYTTVGSEPSR